MIHLICGPIGAGKTTIAHQLAEQHNAIRFSEDEWLSNLFIPDAPENLLDESIEMLATWAAEKYQRCRGQIWPLCEQLLKQGIHVVLDGAAANKEQRDKIREKAAKSGVGFKLYYVTADKETRRSRVLERNAKGGKTYSMQVSVEMFELMEHLFEMPELGELSSAEIIKT